MPSITINGKKCEFAAGQSILQVALANEIEIPHYCWHPGLSVVASCRICLAEVWAPNPRNNNMLEPIPKLVPTCQTPAGDGQVVYIDSPKAIANQKAVMEYLLINHPVDCPVCDQAGECYLQDYSYDYGRGQSRFEEQKTKQPKKDLGDHVLLYSDRCIMCSRCVRFTREVTGTAELMVEGRGSGEQIDVFPGVPLNNELSANVIDLCPVGALLDKDFLFQQRVWFLEKTPSIDGITSSGDNISIEHNKGQIYRVKPRTNLDVNKWWITDEVRYGWKFVHSEDRLTMPRVKGEEPFEAGEAGVAWETAIGVANERLSGSKRIAVMMSPMLSCEDAYLLATYAKAACDNVVFGVGPVPRDGQDKTFPGGFTMRAEKAPNARGVRRVLEKLDGSKVHDFDEFIGLLQKSGDVDAVVLTGNYPSNWVVPRMIDAIQAVDRRFVVLIDTLLSQMVPLADVVLPSATWAEKSGTFENYAGHLQAFAKAIEPIDFCKGEGQIACDLLGVLRDDRAKGYDAAHVRSDMAAAGLSEFAEIESPAETVRVDSDMAVVEL